MSANIMQNDPNAFGSTFQKLLKSNADPNVLRTNSVLQYDEWKEIDDAVLPAARERLRFVNEVMNLGLTRNIPNAMGKSIYQFDKQNDSQVAQLSMDGISRGQSDTVEFSTHNIPLPLIHSDFQLTLRRLQTSRNMGEALDTTQAEHAARRVSETIEDLSVNGTPGFTFSGETIYGATNHPDRNTVSFSNASWTDSGVTGTDILTDVLDMITSLENAGYFGPYRMYIPTSYGTGVLEQDFKADSDKTIRQRLNEIESLESITVLDALASDTVVMFQPTRSVFQMLDGVQPTTVQWEEEGGMKLNFKVLSIMVPNWRSDFNGNMGLVVLS